MLTSLCTTISKLKSKVVYQTCQHFEEISIELEVHPTLLRANQMQIFLGGNHVHLREFLRVKQWLLYEYVNHYSLHRNVQATRSLCWNYPNCLQKQLQALASMMKYHHNRRVTNQHMNHATQTCIELVIDSVIFWELAHYCMHHRTLTSMAGACMVMHAGKSNETNMQSFDNILLIFPQ